MFEPPYALWSIWKELGLLSRLFIELLFAPSAYCLFVSSRTVARLRTLERHDSNECMISIDEALAPLYRSLRNTRRIIGATFYLFGFVLFLGLENIVNTVGGDPFKVILGGFVLSCAFAANVFFIIFVLHVIEWLVYLMLNRCSRRLNDRSRGREDGLGNVSA